MKRRYLVLGVGLGLLFPILGTALAQNEPPVAPIDETQPPLVPMDEMNEGEEMKYSFGTVVNVSDQEVVIREYDYSKDAEVEVSYTVTPETQFDNIATAAELAADDNVEVYFKEMDGKNVASILIKEVISEQDWEEMEEPLGNIVNENYDLPAGDDMMEGLDSNMMMEEMPMDGGETKG